MNLQENAIFSSIIGKLQKAQFLLFISTKENRKKKHSKRVTFFLDTYLASKIKWNSNLRKFFFWFPWKSKRNHTNYKIISLSVWICRLVFQYLFLSQPYPPIKFTKWSYEFFSTMFWNRKSSLMTIYLKCNFYSHFMEHEFYVLKTNIITRPQNNLRSIFVCALFRRA